jgi:glycosyltransferase involved in cell wall biosynthesis
VLSIILPSWKDPLLAPTVAGLLAQAHGDIEVLPVIDGYTLQVTLPDDPRVRVIQRPVNGGMREAINTGVAAARGEWLMRMDEHQRVGPGYDVILTGACPPDAIMTPRRYALDPVRWAIMEDIPPIDYMALKIVHYTRKDGTVAERFTGVEWPRPDRASLIVDETMAMQGSCWMMPHAWWDRVIGRLESEGYGPLVQDSHEMVFKTWQAGGRLLVNKGTWHAHKHRKFPRTHHMGTKTVPANAEQSYAHALTVWRDYYEQEIRPRWGI